MLREVDETTMWLQDPTKIWSDSQFAVNKLSIDTDGLLEKVNEDKLARDVDDLAAIFEELAEGVDFPLPCDDLEIGCEVAGGWIEGLDSDVINVNELSEAFDELIAEQDTPTNQAALSDKDSDAVDLTGESSSEYDDEDEEMEDSEDDDGLEDTPRSVSVQIVPSPPVWASSAPLDPRSCIRTPVFKNLDSRIPQIDIPRIDLSFSGQRAVLKATGVTSTSCSVQKMSPKREKTKVVAYHHDPSTCWICKSSKTPEKKRALHRYHEKRTRRNWKRGPRYSGRSHVAASRVRNGGRFICTTQWI